MAKRGQRDTPPSAQMELPTPEESKKKPKKKETPEERAERVEREKQRLIEDVAANIADDLNQQVAFILNHYPETRDSDLKLAKRLWETFYPEEIEDSLDDLYHLPRQTTIERTRRKIQNEYRLYAPSQAVADNRRALRRQTSEAMVADKPGPPVISVYADESGKNQRYLVVGSIWVLDIARQVRLELALREWKKTNGIQAELKFAELNKSNVETAKDFVRQALEHGTAMGFKATVLDSSKVRGLAKEPIVFRLYHELAMAGLEHEVRTGRVVLPRWLTIVKDADTGTDILALPELERKLAASVAEHFREEAKVDGVTALASHTSTLLQLADLFTGSIGRVMNDEGSGTHAKDQFAQFMEGLAGFTFAEPAPSDAKDLVYVRRLT